jgi:hypothetical protein
VFIYFGFGLYMRISTTCTKGFTSKGVSFYQSDRTR